MKTTKTILCALLLIAGLFIGRTSNAQTPDYTHNPAHPAYSTGYTFNSNPDFLRGWCFAWDAVSPVAQLNVSITLLKRNIDMSAPAHTFPYTIWSDVASDGSPIWITVDVQVKNVMSYTLTTMNLSAPETSILYTAGEEVEQYAYTLTTQEEINFWLGYAASLKEAGMNPNFLYIQRGQTM